MTSTETYQPVAAMRPNNLSFWIEWLLRSPLYQTR